MHEQEKNDIESRLERIEKILEPMAEAYTAANTIGKWLVGLVTFISILFGIALALKELFKK